jgi:hypothetical protein
MACGFGDDRQGKYQHSGQLGAFSGGQFLVGQAGHLFMQSP